MKYKNIYDYIAKNMNGQCGDFTVTVTAGTNTFDATCSAMTFCYNALINVSNTDLQNLAKALYLYNVQANAYFK